MSETDEVPVAEAALEARLADVSADAAALRVLLPAELQSLISDTVVRSHKLYEEFVDRLVLRVARETGLEAATREPASAAEVEIGRASCRERGENSVDGRAMKKKRL